jgi:ABC-type phosphate/phosphonate transport system permease subunit
MPALAGYFAWGCFLYFCWAGPGPFGIFGFPVGRLFDSICGVDMLIWALVWINVSASAPLPALAIAVSDFGAFGQLFSEAIEAADKSKLKASGQRDWISGKWRLAIIGRRAVARHSAN